MNALLKELSKLERLTETGPTLSASAKSKSPSVTDSLDALILSLNSAKAALESGCAPQEVWPQTLKDVESKKKDIDDRQKEIYSSVARIGKALDKKFPTSLPTFEPLFSSAESVKSLERTISAHLLRTGQFKSADIFNKETSTDTPPEFKEHFAELHRIMQAIHTNDVAPALDWAGTHRDFLQSRSSSLEFHLHRARYLQLLLSSPFDSTPAIQYATQHLTPYYPKYPSEFLALTTAVVYLSDLSKSPYAHLLSPSMQADLEAEFSMEYCASIGRSKQVPLRVVCDIGGGGALNRIEKGRKVMRDTGRGWSQTEELPIEIPLPPENRYHSIFACPVSKEQTTEQNPPMMMACGHVIAKDSLHKLSKPGGRVKCPYCPVESQMSASLRLYF